MKRLVCWFLAFAMLLPTIVLADNNTRTSGLYTYEIKGNGTITITDFDWDKNTGDIYIPNMIDGYTITAIGDEAFAKDKYEAKETYSVTLPEGIKTIGEKAFFCANINAINLPSTLQQIGSAAFYGCPECQFKLMVNHPYFAVIDDGLYNKANKELIAYSTGLIEYGATITIPEGIQVIGAYALAMCQSAYGTDLSLPSTLVSIGDYAFSGGCYLITGDLSNLKSIGTGAFYNSGCSCDLLEMPSVEKIGDYAFEKAWMEGYLFFSNESPIQIGDNAFSSNIKNCIFIYTQNCANIGSNNYVLGMLMTDSSSFSPLLTAIPSGLNPKVNALPDTVTAIESGAFTEKKSDFRLSQYLKDIAVDAFPVGSTFIVDAGSYAELWCSENGFGYSIEGQEDDLSWLN